MERFISETEASSRYGRSRAWFQRKRWDGTGPEFVKVDGGSVLYDVEKLEEWFGGRTYRSTSEYETRKPANRSASEEGLQLSLKLGSTSK